MCIVNRIKEKQKGLFFPRETYDPIDDLGDIKRHLSRKACMVNGENCHGATLPTVKHLHVHLSFVSRQPNAW